MTHQSINIEEIKNNCLNWKTNPYNNRVKKEKPIKKLRKIRSAKDRKVKK
jgi:hypothetical protein